MEAAGTALLGAAAASAAAWLYWRYVWFWRNPPRRPPEADGVVSAADGRVVYVRTVAPGEPVVSLKKGRAATLEDIAREEMRAPQLLVGVFMSPFDVHYNRAPVSGRVEFVRHYPGDGANRHMGRLHGRLLLGRQPYGAGCEHIVQNERTVTKIVGERDGVPFPCYVVQIAARSVSGIDSWVAPGMPVARGEIFGMIRIGSQVDVVVPLHPRLRVRVRPGERVRAGETLLCDFGA